MTQAEYARRVGKDKSHVSRLVSVWRRFGDVSDQRRPRFTDAMATIQFGTETMAEGTRRARERQVPTRREDRVAMATELMSDPEVVAAVTKTPTRARSEIREAITRQNAAEREQAREWNRQRAIDGALPFPAYMARMTMKINEFGGSFQGLYESLDELPDCPERDTLARAVEYLIEQAQRWLDKLRDPGLIVIEGGKGQ